MNIETNTPLRRPPPDYCPRGSERWFQIPDGLDAGKTLFYSDQAGAGAQTQATVLFVHGNPESSYTYRHIRDTWWTCTMRRTCFNSSGTWTCGT